MQLQKSSSPADLHARTWRDVVRGNVLAVGLVSMFTDLSSEMIFPFLPVFVAGLVPLASAPLYLGLIEGVAETTSSLLKIVSGRLSDALGRRKALVLVGYGLSSVLRPMLAFVTAGWHVVLVRFGDRIGKGVRTSPRDALIGDSVGPDVRGLAFGFHRAMDHAGAVIGPLVALGALHALLGHGFWQASAGQPSPDEMAALRWLFALAAVPGLCAVLTVVLGVRERAPAAAGRAAAHEATRDQTAGHEAPAAPAWRKLPGRFYSFVGIVVLFALGNSSDLFLLFYGRSRFDIGLSGIVGLWILLHVSKMVWSVPGGMLSDRHGRRVVIVAGWLVYALVYLGLAFVDESWQLWALMAVYGLFYGLTEGAEKALVTDLVPAELRGTALGLHAGAVGFAALPASLIFGVFWSVIGPRLAFGIGASLAALASVLLVLHSRRRAR